MTATTMQAIDLRVSDRVRVQTWTSLGRRMTWATIADLSVDARTVTVTDATLGEFSFPRADAVTVRPIDA